jgi:hypothetical protein
MQMGSEAADDRRIGVLNDPVVLLELVDETGDLAAAPRLAFAQSAPEVQHERGIVDECHAAVLRRGRRRRT